MDVLKKKANNKKPRLIHIVGILAAFAVCFIFVSFTQNLSPQIDLNKVQVANVEYGSLQVKVSAFGNIKSDRIHVISNYVDGIVTEVLVHNGDFVEAGQTILKLTNLELQNIVDELSWGLEELESQHNELVLKNKALLIKEEFSLFEIKKQLDISKLNLEAQEKLIKFDNVVSKIDYEETKLNNIMLKSQYKLAQAKYEHLKQQIAATRAAHLAKIKKNQKILARSQKQVEDLTVKTTFSGHLDQFELEVGQQLNKGVKVARIIGKDGFYAELSVPEYNVNSIKISQDAVVETRGGTFVGQVTRISPSVSDGRIKVNVSITQTDSLIPKLDQSVEGQIITKSIDATYFVRKPIYARENITTMAFISRNADELYSRFPISFGELSNEYIEIRSGVEVDDKILISDISEYANHQHLEIN